MKGRAKAAPDLAHCFELHSGKLLGDKRNREGRLYFKVSDGCVALRHSCFGNGEGAWELLPCLIMRSLGHFWPFSLFSTVV